MEGYTDLRALTAGLCSRWLVGRVTTSLPSEIRLTRIFNFFLLFVRQVGNVSKHSPRRKKREGEKPLLHQDISTGRFSCTSNHYQTFVGCGVNTDTSSRVCFVSGERS